MKNRLLKVKMFGIKHGEVENEITETFLDDCAWKLVKELNPIRKKRKEMYLGLHKTTLGHGAHGCGVFFRALLNVTLEATFKGTTLVLV